MDDSSIMLPAHHTKVQRCKDSHTQGEKAQVNAESFARARAHYQNVETFVSIFMAIIITAGPLLCRVSCMEWAQFRTG